MPIDRFTTEQFEAALPRHKVTGATLWVPVGIIDNEKCYIIPVHSKPNVGVLVRSSIDHTGVCADCGEDSIRVYPVEYRKNEAGQTTLTPLGSKTQAWVTRVPGWAKRLQTVLRKVYKLALRTQPCPKCQKTMAIVKIKRGSNTGKYAVACMDQTHAQFHVIEGAV